jgi:hypothetical protein
MYPTNALHVWASLHFTIVLMPFKKTSKYHVQQWMPYNNVPTITTSGGSILVDGISHLFNNMFGHINLGGFNIFLCNP